MKRLGIKYGDLDQIRWGKQLEAKATAELGASARTRIGETLRWPGNERPD